MFHRRSRGTGRRPGQGSTRSVPSDSDPEQEMVAVMKEIYGSSWSLGMSAVNLSLPAFGAGAHSQISPPLNFDLDTPELEETSEAVYGDPDTTLRLVLPPDVQPSD